MKSNRNHLTVTAGSLIGLFWSWSVLAQEATVESAATVASREGTLTLLQLIKAGGLTMFPLALFSIAVVALVIRNFITLKESKLLPAASVVQLQNSLSALEIDEAIRHCRAHPSMLTATIEAGLERIPGDTIQIENVKEAIEEAGTEQMLSLMRPINYLSIIGSVSPMLGLLGTVSGMIKAFQAISFGGMGKPEVLAGHIGEALVTTATGLIIAIPAMLFYFYFKNNFLKSMASMGRITGRMIDSLTAGMTAAAQE